jgi:starch-binding outer membrane protein, SusD/RagB family
LTATPFRWPVLTRWASIWASKSFKTIIDMKNTMQAYKKLPFLLLLLFSLMLPNACQKDLLEPEPINQFGEGVIFNTPDRFVSLLNGLYDAMKSGNYYGGRFIVYGDIRGEEFLNETGNLVTGAATWNHTVVSTTNEVNNLWTAIYFTINYCNIYIDGAEKNKAVVGDDAKVQSYIAEARFIRAVCYQSLLTLYCRPYADGNGSQLGVPLRIRPETGISNNNLVRSTVAEVYNQILQDLDFAIQNLPAKQVTTLQNVTRAHQHSAIAFKTRVLLNMGRYGDLITEANKIVSAAAPFKAPATGVEHQLQANIKNVFTAPYTTTESIFSMPFTSTDLPGTQNGLGHYHNPAPRGNGEYALNKVGIIGDSVHFPASDARRQFVTASGAKFFMSKFAAGPEHLDYAPVIRYAEVLLNLAEAEARQNGVNQRAVDLLNAVRGRSDAAVQFTTADFANGDELAAAILVERRIELLGEGFRSSDCMRLLQPIPGKSNVSTIQPTDKAYIWPIPSLEIAANKDCVQNP